MKNQQSFELNRHRFAKTHSRSSDPETSFDAALSMASYATGTIKDRVLALMRKVGRPIAAEEVTESLRDLRYDQVWKRMSDLRNDKLIEGSSLKHRNRSGRLANMWKLTDNGRECADERMQGVKNILMRKG